MKYILYLSGLPTGRRSTPTKLIGNTSYILASFVILNFDSSVEIIDNKSKKKNRCKSNRKNSKWVNTRIMKEELFEAGFNKISFTGYWPSLDFQIEALLNTFVLSHMFLYFTKI